MAGPRDYLKKAGDIRRTMDGQPQRMGDIRIPAPAPMQMPGANSESPSAERTMAPASNYRPAMPLNATSPSIPVQQTYMPTASKGLQRADSGEVGKRMAPSVQPPLWPTRDSKVQRERPIESMPAQKAEQSSQRQATPRAESGEDQLQRQTMRIAPQPIGGHALYRELMRSHDRMGTLHVKKEG